MDGVELDENDAKLASHKLRNVWALNIETDELSELGNNKYDIIYFGDVIEHLVDPVSVLHRIEPLLEYHGKIIFSIPNMGHIGVRLALLTGEFEYTETGLLDKTHLHFYTQKEVVRVFELAGYSITKLDFVEKDYPRKLIEKQLSSNGLKASSKFYKKMSQTDASAFQFVGVAEPAKIRVHKLKQFGPIDLFEKFYEDTKSGYEEQIRNLKLAIDELNKTIKYKEKYPYRNIVGYVKRKVARK